MSEYLSAAPVSKGAKIAGWVISILVSLLLLMSASFKFMQPKEFVEGLEKMGWAADLMFKIGFVEVACVVLYLIPRTSVLGAILIAAYMGGAVATHVRVGEPFYTQVLVGVFAWLALYLRDTRIRSLIPFRS